MLALQRVPISPPEDGDLPGLVGRGGRGQGVPAVIASLHVAVGVGRGGGAALGGGTGHHLLGRDDLGVVETWGKDEIVRTLTSCFIYEVDSENEDHVSFLRTSLKILTEKA